MKKSGILIIAFTIGLLTACVPAKKMEELQVKYNNLQSDFDELTTMKKYGDQELVDLQAKYKALNENHALTHFPGHRYGFI